MPSVLKIYLRKYLLLIHYNREEGPANKCTSQLDLFNFLCVGRIIRASQHAELKKTLSFRFFVLNADTVLVKLLIMQTAEIICL